MIDGLAIQFLTRKTQSNKTAFDPYYQKSNGINDAYIMACAKVLGMSIITSDNHFRNNFFGIRETAELFKDEHITPNNLNKYISRNYDFVTSFAPSHFYNGPTDELVR